MNLANQVLDPISIGYADDNNLGCLLKGCEAPETDPEDLQDAMYAVLKDGKFDLISHEILEQKKLQAVSVGQATSSPILRSESLIQMLKNPRKLN